MKSLKNRLLLVFYGLFIEALDEIISQQKISIPFICNTFCRRLPLVVDYPHEQQQTE